MKAILIILDGLGDRPSERLDFKTPLEAAHTPHLDRIAARGINGLISPLGRGIPLETITAHWLLWGYRLSNFPRRALFEATGEDVPFDDDDALCCARFATVKESGAQLLVKRRKVPATEAEFRSLVALLPPETIDGISFAFRYTRRGQGILVLKGPVSDDLTDSDPAQGGAPVLRVCALDGAVDGPAAEQTARALNVYLERTWHRLKDAAPNLSRQAEGLDPANFLLTRWASRPRPIQPFAERWQLQGCSIHSLPILTGLVRQLGMDVWPVEPQSNVCADFRRRLELALEALEGGRDFVHVHTIDPDTVAHTGDPGRKRGVIEEIDRAFEGLLPHLLRDDTVVALTGDHSTASVGRAAHTGDPLPIAISGRHVRQDDVTEFGERAAMRGGLGHLTGGDLMPILIDLMDRSTIAGTRLSARPGLARPANPRSFHTGEQG